MSFRNLLLIQLIASAAMTGIIWLVQIAVYPLFAKLSAENFDTYHAHYMDVVTIVIAPLMLIEAASCAACFFLGDKKTFFLPAALLGVAWLSTAFIQVPQHAALSIATVPALVASNWIRTAAWTLRTGLLAMILIRLQK
ncbi:hypothetical protein N9134_01545 [Akkermansiaceae bacterium]|nr:hypothetical protein [bacterium]MDA7862037.1 hypothetical protein [Akkermansiaceae bacterium]MDB4271392.1 hypothetical protein [Akkermansiaceae bacterium]MDB4386897.1 hypothetical protein [Akkermansiaceae bacterium]MDB4406867.1 hypothetical protein [Akkermansiaceae bacterium]